MKSLIDQRIGRFDQDDDDVGLSAPYEPTLARWTDEELYEEEDEEWTEEEDLIDTEQEASYGDAAGEGAEDEVGQGAEKDAEVAFGEDTRELDKKSEEKLLIELMLKEFEITDGIDALISPDSGYSQYCVSSTLEEELLIILLVRQALCE